MKLLIKASRVQMAYDADDDTFVTGLEIPDEAGTVLVTDFAPYQDSPNKDEWYAHVNITVLAPIYEEEAPEEE
jgi:hypothetical protein